VHDELVLKEIMQAKRGLADAENELARLLREVKVAPRAEKTTISEALNDAFQKLRDARARLGRLEALLRGEDDGAASGP
jgi:hypothetical protein